MYEDYSENVEFIFNQDCREKKRTGNGIHGRAARLRKKECVRMPSERETDKLKRRLILGAGPCFVTTIKELNLVEWLQRIENGEWISIEELRGLPFEDGQKVYAQIRRLHTTQEIYRGFSCSSAQVSELSWHFQVARQGNQIIVGEPALDVLRGFADHRANQAEQKRLREESENGNNNQSESNEQKQQIQQNSNNVPVTTNGKSTRKYTPRGQGKKALEKAKKEAEMQKIIDSTYKDAPEQIEPSKITLVEVKKPEIDLLRISVKNVYTAEQVLAFLTRLQLFVEGQSAKFELSVTLQETNLE